MLIGSSSSLQAIVSGADFDVGTALPVEGQQTGVLVDNTSLWVSDELPHETLDAVSQFRMWLTEPDHQMRWHRETDYFPVHEAAIPKLRSDG